MNPVGPNQLFVETAYDMLGAAIDAVGGERESLFLAKLVLLLANEVGDTETLQGLIQTAQQEFG